MKVYNGKLNIWLHFVSCFCTQLLRTVAVCIRCMYEWLPSDVCTCLCVCVCVCVCVYVCMCVCVCVCIWIIWMVKRGKFLFPAKCHIHFYSKISNMRWYLKNTNALADENRSINDTVFNVATLKVFLNECIYYS